MELGRDRTIEPFDIRTVSTYPYDGLLERLARVEGLLDSNGIDLKPGSRIDQYRRAITDFRQAALGSQLQTSLDWGMLHQAAYELGVITDAVHELSKPPEVCGWKERVAKVLEGPTLPQYQRLDKSPWPFQYEIQLATVFRRADYGVRFDEPDIVVTHPELAFGIAAKRPLSRKKVSRNLRDGAKQIVGAGYEGIVALDVTVLHNPRNELLAVTNSSDALLDLEVRTNHFLNRNSGLIRTCVSSPKVFGVLVSLTALYLDREPCFASATRWVVMNLCDQSSPRHQILTDLVRRLGKAISAS